MIAMTAWNGLNRQRGRSRATRVRSSSPSPARTPISAASVCAVPSVCCVPCCALPRCALSGSMSVVVAGSVTGIEAVPWTGCGTVAVLFALPCCIRARNRACDRVLRDRAACAPRLVKTPMLPACGMHRHEVQLNWGMWSKATGLSTFRRVAKRCPTQCSLAPAQIQPCNNTNGDRSL